MTFNPLAAINSTFISTISSISSISSLPSLIKDKRKVVDLGSQTLNFDHNFVKFLIQKFPSLEKLNINNLEKIILKMEKTLSQ
jgi:hypothetical protein